jgi:hypothetical protein
MDTEILTGPTNRFDSGLMLGNREIKAIRDVLLSLLEKVKALEARISPANREMVEEVKEEPTDEPVKRGRPKKNA